MWYSQVSDIEDSKSKKSGVEGTLYEAVGYGTEQAVWCSQDQRTPRLKTHTLRTR
jgi:hypothetical protein